MPLLLSFVSSLLQYVLFKAHSVFSNSWTPLSLIQISICTLKFWILQCRWLPFKSSWIMYRRIHAYTSLAFVQILTIHTLKVLKRRWHSCKPLCLCRKPGVRCCGRWAHYLLWLRYDGPAEHAFEARTGEPYFRYLWERCERSGGLVGRHGRHPQG